MSCGDILDDRHMSGIIALLALHLDMTSLLNTIEAMHYRTVLEVRYMFMYAFTFVFVSTI